MLGTKKNQHNVQGVLDRDRLRRFGGVTLRLLLLDRRGGERLWFRGGGERLALLERLRGGDRLREGDLEPERCLLRRGLRDRDRLFE